MSQNKVVHLNQSIIDPATGDMGVEGTENLKVKLAITPDEKEAVFHLRYKVFYDEMGAKKTPEVEAIQMDRDQYDEVCDHLMVLDTSREGDVKNQIVGTYRMVRWDMAEKAGGFYSANEFDISTLESYTGHAMELGRSAVHPNYRNRPTMQLLWRGLAAYLVEHKIDLMFGCASFPSNQPEKFKEQLSYLYHYHLAPPALRAKTLPEYYVDINMMPQEEIDPKKVLHSLPPLVKGYLRVGCYVSDGAYIDHDFNTTDVMVMVDTDAITEGYALKYLSKYIEE